MDNEEYLNLFKKIQEDGDDDQNQELQNLNETPNYNEYQNPEKTQNFSQFQNMNEVRREDYTINEQANDAWSQSIEIETRIDGQVVKRGNANPDPYAQRKKQNDPNGLGQFLEEDNLNEVIRPKVNTNQQHVQNNQETEHESDINVRALNESSLTYKDSDVVTAEMWNNWCEASIYPLALNLKQL